VNIIENIIDFLWPTIGRFTEAEEKANKKTMEEFGSPEKIMEKIDYIKDGDYIQTFADVAKNLYVDEEMRVKTVEGKLVTLLGATGLVITLIAEFSDKINSIDANNIVGRIFIILFFSSTLIYLLTSAIYALRGLDRKAYHKLDTKNIIDSKFKNKADFLKEISSCWLSNRTKNYLVINEKVDSMVMALKYFKRGMFTAVITGALYMLFDNFKIGFLVSSMPNIASSHSNEIYIEGSILYRVLIFSTSVAFIFLGTSLIRWFRNERLHLPLAYLGWGVVSVVISFFPIFDLAFCDILSLLIGIFVPFFPEIKKVLSKKTDTVGEISLIAGLIASIAFPLLVSSYISSGEQIRLLREQVTAFGTETDLLQSQVGIFNSILISQLADSCIWQNYYGGERLSYERLDDMKRKADTYTVHQIFTDESRIKDMYKSGVFEVFLEKLGAVCRPNTNCKEFEDENNFSVKDAVDQIHYPEWASRAKSAYFLGKVTNQKVLSEKQKWEDVLDGLADALDYKEYSLSVSKAALNSYCSLTGYQAKDIFDFQGALDDWHTRRDTILKALKNS